MEIISRKEAKERGLKRYFTGKPCKHGHTSERNATTGKCLECHKARMKSSRADYYKSSEYEIIERLKSEWIDYFQSPELQSKRREANRLYKQWSKDDDFIKRRREASRKQRENPCFTAKRRAYYRKTVEHRRAYARVWSRANVDYAEVARKYRQQNPEAAFARSSLRRLELGFELPRFEVTFGYTREEFIQHIESQFTSGMSWERRSEFHVDHIKPIKAFLDEGITDPAIINALDNLQPLWAKDNLSKGAKYDE